MKDLLIRVKAAISTLAMATLRTNAVTNDEVDALVASSAFLMIARPREEEEEKKKKREGKGGKGRFSTPNFTGVKL